MATLQDIENQKNTAVAMVNAKIADASAKEAAAASQAEQDQWDGVIEKLNAKRDDIIDQAYEGETSAPEIQQAVDALRAATDELNHVAGQMTKLTSYLSFITALLGAADTVVGILSGA